MWVDPGREGWRIFEGGAGSILPITRCEKEEVEGEEEDDDDDEMKEILPRPYLSKIGFGGFNQLF